MNLIEFNNTFPDEGSCREHMRLRREELGITCKNCQSIKHYWLSKMQKWECANCKSRITLRSGTLMEHSHLGIRLWYLTIHLMTSVKKDFSALEMQRQLGLKRYEPVWYMMQKIRVAMGKRDIRYQLKGAVEMDDAFFVVVDLEKDGEELTKRGRGSQRNAQVLVMVESTANPAQDKKHKKKRIMGYVKMLVMDNLKNENINNEVELGIESRSTVLTDGYKGFGHLHKVIAKHVAMKITPEEAHKKLPWVHTVIANAKRGLLGVHHSIGKDYLQNYLNEFCYKINRRNFRSDLFDRMVIASLSDTWY